MRYSRRLLWLSLVLWSFLLPAPSFAQATHGAASAGPNNSSSGNSASNGSPGSSASSSSQASSQSSSAADAHTGLGKANNDASDDGGSTGDNGADSALNLSPTEFGHGVASEHSALHMISGIATRLREGFVSYVKQWEYGPDELVPEFMASDREINAALTKVLNRPDTQKRKP